MTCQPRSRADALAAARQILPETTAGLRTLIIGPDVAVRTGSPVAYSGSLLTVPLSGLLAGDTPLAVDVVGTAVEVGYLIESGTATIANGRMATGGANRIEHDAGSTVFAGANRSVGIPIDVLIGDAVRLSNGTDSLISTVTDFVYSGPDPVALVLADDLPIGLQSGFFLITLAEKVSTWTLSSGLTLTSTDFEVAAGLTLATTRTGTPYPVVYALLGYGYTARRSIHAGQVLRINSAADLSTEFEGWQDPRSELGFAAWQALAPGPNPFPVLVAAVDPAVFDWTAAIGLISARTDWSVVTPLTTAASVLSDLRQVLTARAASKRRSQMICAAALPSVSELLNSPAVVTVDQSQTPGQDRTVVRTGGQASPFAQAAPGDALVIAGDTYIIATVVSSGTVTLTTSATAGAGQALTSITRALTPEQQVLAYGVTAAGLASDSVSMVFPPLPEWNGQPVAGYLLAAALAGVRGQAAPQSSLVRIGLDGWSVPAGNTTYFAYQSLAAELGLMYVAGCDESPTPAFVTSGRTTDQSDFISGREQISSIKTAVERYLATIITPFEQLGTPVANFVNQLSSDLGRALTRLTQTNVNDLGPIIVGSSIDNISTTDIPGVLLVEVTVTILVGIEQVDLLLTVEIGVSE